MSLGKRQRDDEVTALNKRSRITSCPRMSDGVGDEAHPSHDSTQALVCDEANVSPYMSSVDNHQVSQISSSSEEAASNAHAWSPPLIFSESYMGQTNRANIMQPIRRYTEDHPAPGLCPLPPATDAVVSDQSDDDLHNDLTTFLSSPSLQAGFEPPEDTASLLASEDCLYAAGASSPAPPSRQEATGENNSHFIAATDPAEEHETPPYDGHGPTTAASPAQLLQMPSQTEVAEHLYAHTKTETIAHPSASSKVVQPIPSQAHILSGKQLDFQQRWLNNIKDEFTGKPAQVIPGISRDSALPLDGARLMLLPQNIWKLRSLSAGERHSAFFTNMSLVQKLTSVDSASDERSKLWVQIHEMSAFLVRNERTSHVRYFLENDAALKKLRSAEWEAHIEAQIAEIPLERVISPRPVQLGSVSDSDYTPSLSSGITGHPEHDVPLTPLALNSPDVLSHGSGSSNLVHPLLEHGYAMQPTLKRRASAFEGEVTVAKRARDVIDLTEEETATPIIWSYDGRQAIQKITLEANLREYQANQQNIDNLYLGNGTNQHRSKSDPIATKLAVWKANKDRLANTQQARQQQPQQTIAPAVQLARDSAAVARMPDGSDEPECPKLPSENLTDYSQIAPEVYRCLHYNNPSCGTPACTQSRHECCRTGYTTEKLETAVERQKGRTLSKIETLVESGKLDARHKTWVGYYDPGLATKNGQQKLLVDSLQWTERGKEKAKQRALKLGRDTVSRSVTPAIPGVLQPFPVVQSPLPVGQQLMHVYQRPTPHVPQQGQPLHAPQLNGHQFQQSVAPQHAPIQQAQQSQPGGGELL